MAHAHNVKIFVTLNIAIYDKEINSVLDYVDKLYGLKDISNLLLFVGRLNSTKNFDFLLDSLAELKKLHGPNFLLLAVGGGNFSAFEKKLQELDLTRNVRILGEISDRKIIQSLYLRSDLHVCPSTIETFGMTIQEAASQKTPSITIEHIATSNNIIDEENGFITSLNPLVFASKISVALSDKQKLTEIGEKAFLALNNSWEDITKKYLEEYSKIIEHKKEQ